MGGNDFIPYLYVDVTPRIYVVDLKVRHAGSSDQKDMFTLRFSPTHTGFQFRVHDQVNEIMALHDDLSLARVSWSY